MLKLKIKYLIFFAGLMKLDDITEVIVQLPDVHQNCHHEIVRQSSTLLYKNETKKHQMRK